MLKTNGRSRRTKCLVFEIKSLVDNTLVVNVNCNAWQGPREIRNLRWDG